MFDRDTIKKKKRKSGNCNYPNNVVFVNLFKNRKQYIKGRIGISHYMEHNCLILFFNFDGF